MKLDRKSFRPLRGVAELFKSPIDRAFWFPVRVLLTFSLNFLPFGSYRRVNLLKNEPETVFAARWGLEAFLAC
jgi:hypothetical protein